MKWSSTGSTSSLGCCLKLDEGKFQMAKRETLKRMKVDLYYILDVATLGLVDIIILDIIIMLTFLFNGK